MNDAPKTKEKRIWWNVRELLPTIDAMQKYDKYLKEHKHRLQQLEKEARGDMAPSDEWYRE